MLIQKALVMHKICNLSAGREIRQNLCQASERTTVFFNIKQNKVTTQRNLDLTPWLWNQVMLCSSNSLTMKEGGKTTQHFMGSKELQKVETPLHFKIFTYFLLLYCLCCQVRSLSKVQLCIKTIALQGQDYSWACKRPIHVGLAKLGEFHFQVTYPYTVNW